MVAGAKPQQRRRPVTQMGEHELAARAVLDDRAPVCGSTSSACTIPGPPDACRPASHSPHSETPMSPMPIASVTLAPQPSSSRARMAGSPPPGSPATSSADVIEDPEVEIRSAAHSSNERRRMASSPRRWASEAGSRHQAVGVAGADRDMANAQPVEGAQRCARHERAGIVGRHDGVPAPKPEPRIVRADVVSQLSRSPRVSGM